jgi:hypothetical protein
MLRTSCCKSGGAATASGVWALGLVVTRLVGGAVGAAADIFLRANQRARPRRSGGAGVCPPRCCGTRRGSNPDRRTAAKEDASRATVGMGAEVWRAVHSGVVGGGVAAACCAASISGGTYVYLHM